MSFIKAKYFAKERDSILHCIYSSIEPQIKQTIYKNKEYNNVNKSLAYSVQRR